VHTPFHFINKQSNALCNNCITPDRIFQVENVNFHGANTKIGSNGQDHLTADFCDRDETFPLRNKKVLDKVPQVRLETVV